MKNPKGLHFDRRRHCGLRLRRRVEFANRLRLDLPHRDGNFHLVLAFADFLFVVGVLPAIRQLLLGPTCQSRLERSVPSRLVGSDLSTWHRLKPTVPYTVVLRIRNSQSEVL